jgi:hypothetical protein
MVEKEVSRKIHVPLGERLYQRLRAESERTGRPATRIAREAIDRYLEEARRTAVHEAIASYAVSCAGTEADLDPSLEASAVEQLRADEGEPRRAARRKRTRKRKG